MASNPDATSPQDLRLVALTLLAAFGVTTSGWGDGPARGAFVSPVFRQGPADTNSPALGTNSVILLDAVTLAVTGWGAVEGSDNSATKFLLDQRQVVNTPTILWPGADVGDAGATLDPGSNLTGGPSDATSAAQDLTTAHTVGVACGEFHTLLLKRDGSVVARGWNQSGQAEVPADLTNAVAVACGADHSLALRRDGSVSAWGYNRFGQCDVPPGLGPVQAVAGGARHSLALLADGRVVAWGNNQFRQLATPADLADASAIAAGAFHSLALTAEGRVLAWGDNSAGQCDVPDALGSVVAIAAGGNFSLALSADGKVVGWGASDRDQTAIPPELSRVVAIAAGDYHGLALREDGTVVAWGDNQYLSSQVPAGLNRVVAIAAGGFHSEALVQALPPLTAGRYRAGRFTADLNLPAGWSYDLETSADLKTWLTVRRARVIPSEMRIDEAAPPGTPAGFFRVTPSATLTVRFLRQ